MTCLRGDKTSRLVLVERQADRFVQEKNRKLNDLLDALEFNQAVASQTLPAKPRTTHQGLVRDSRFSWSQSHATHPLLTLISRDGRMGSLSLEASASLLQLSNRPSGRRRPTPRHTKITNTTSPHRHTNFPTHQSTRQATKCRSLSSSSLCNGPSRSTSCW